LAEIALKAHALGDLKRRDGTSLDLLARLSGCFAGPRIFSPVRNKSVALAGAD
jgi:hypothetical protein